MITKDYILKLLNQHLGDGSVFVTGIRVSSSNEINVFLDGDTGVTIADCVAASRFLEKNLDSEKNDFSLDVSSHGATTPLVVPRQYTKHVGRDFQIKLNDDTKLEGKLLEFNTDELKLEYSVKEDKPIGKGKVLVTKYHIIKYNQIKESKIKLKF